MKDVKFWRYSLPTIDGLEGWGIFILDSTGMFCAVTDYGNYAYKWTHHGCKDFREFFLDGDHGYFLKKLSKADVFQPEDTVRLIKETILNLRKHGGFDRARARKEWTLMENTDFDDPAARHEWYEETKICDAHELFVYDHPASAKCFANKLLSRLAEVIKKELEQENSGVREGVAV